MKKKLFGTMVAVAAMFAGYSAYDAQNESELTEVALANVEALAREENSSKGTLYSNAAGTKYCCCPGGSRSCTAAICKDC